MSQTGQIVAFGKKRDLPFGKSIAKADYGRRNAFHPEEDSITQSTEENNAFQNPDETEDIPERVQGRDLFRSREFEML